MQFDINDPFVHRLALRLPATAAAAAAAAAAAQATSTSSSSSTDADALRVQEALTQSAQLASFWKGAGHVQLLQIPPGAIGGGGDASAKYSWQALSIVRTALDAVNGKPCAAQLVSELIKKKCLLGVLTDLLAWLQQLPQLQQPLLHATAHAQPGSSSPSLEQLWDECMLCLASLLAVAGNRDCQEDGALCRNVQRIAQVLEDKGATYTLKGV
jgi:hypothetical protein